MKKILAILVSAMMIFALAATSFAAPAPAEPAEGETLAESAEGESPEGESPEGESAEEEAVVIIEDQGPADMKVSSFATNNSDTSRKQDEGHIYVGYAITDGALDEENSNWTTEDPSEIVLDDEVEGAGFTAVRAFGDTGVSVSGQLHLFDDTDGQIASDFTGTGAAVTGAEGATVIVGDMNYESEGFGRSFAIIQNGTLVIDNSNLKAMGKNPLTESWDGYYNSANTSMMLSPPWVLGISGGIRVINILGSGTTFVLADSTVTAGGWACVSTDGCQNPYLYMYNSTLEVLPESQGGMTSGWEILGYDPDLYGTGYGTYLIGGAQEYFVGVNIKGATYGSILTGGDAYYCGLTAGEVYEATTEAGELVGKYTAEEDVPTVIDTVFGVMAHNSGSVNVLSGTEINTAASTFLYKSADSEWNLDGAVVNPGNGIIMQMIDNDDSTVGGFNPFNTYLNEEPGFPLEAYDGAVAYVFTTDTEVNPDKTYYTSDTADESGYEVVENPTDEGTVAYYEKATGGNKVSMNLSNGEYTGDIYNATGYYAQAPDALSVTIADSAVLSGDIALTSHVHGIWLNDRNVDDVIAAIDAANAKHAEIGGYYEGLEDVEYVFLNDAGEATDDKDEAVAIQFTKFSTAEYYLLGQVLNMVNYNGLSSIDVCVEGTWKVANVSLVTYLNIAADAQVFGELIELEDGSLLIVPSEESIAPGEYGSVFMGAEAPAPESSGGESGEGESPEGEAAEGESPEGESPEGESPEGESPEGEAPAEPPAGAPIEEVEEVVVVEGDEDLLEEYKAYMNEWLLAEFEVNDNMQEEQLAEFQACIEANDYSQFPGDMFFNGMLENGTAMTFEEFVASR